MKNVIKALLFASSALAINAFAHHGSAPHFDESNTIEIAGAVTKFMFVNPHSYIYFDVTDASGKKTPWRCEITSRAYLETVGWTANTFPPGEKIKIIGNLARREANVCSIKKITFADGRTIGRQGKLGTAPAIVVPATAAKGAPRAARTADGKPNVAGFWVSQGMGATIGDAGNPARGSSPGLSVALTPAGEAAGKAYSMEYDDPAIRCDAGNIIVGLTHDQNVNKIEQSTDKIVLTYGYMDLVRTVHLNMATHPKTITPSTAGHSIGKWEGDVLVVDTIGFKQAPMIPLAGLMHSNKLHITEKFTVDNTAGTLTHDYVAEDTLFYKTPYTGRDVLTLTAIPYKPYACVALEGKNNERPK